MWLLWLLCLPMIDVERPLLQAELELGADDPDVYFGMGTRLVVDSAGVMYVLEPSKYAITVFDADGRQLRSLGRRGNGPGEFQEPAALMLDDQQQLVVLDTGLKRAIKLSRQGGHLGTSHFEAGIVAVRDAVALGRGRLGFVAAKLSKNGKPIHDLSVYDAKMAVERSLFHLEVPVLDWTQSKQRSFWVQFLKQQLELLGKPMPVIAAAGDGSFVWGNITRYQLNHYGADGVVGETVSREVKALPFGVSARDAAFRTVWNNLCGEAFLAQKLDRSVFQAAAAKAEVAPILPVIHRICGHETGFAVLYNYHPSKKQGTLALHNLKGDWQRDLAFEGPADTITMAGNKLYTVGENADDEIVITRYSIRPALH